MSQPVPPDIIQYAINSACYYNSESTKSQIYLHSSLLNVNPFRLIDFYAYNIDSDTKTAPSFIISSNPKDIYSNYTDGTIVQAYSSKYWSHHLYLKESHLIQGGPGIDSLSRNSISVELCNWGPLIATEHGICTTTGIYLKDSEVYEFNTPYRGYKYYNKYTDAQIENLKKLLLLLGKKWNINTKSKGIGIFSIDRRALTGQPGIFCHNSVRPDITDLSPQPILIEMLNSL
jgi:hypothetical protein